MRYSLRNVALKLEVDYTKKENYIITIVIKINSEQLRIRRATEKERLKKAHVFIYPERGIQMGILLGVRRSLLFPGRSCA
jgi:hypothetical protein